MTLTDEQLVEEIKKVTVEKAKPKQWENCIKRRYLDWSITKGGKGLILEFFNTIGEGPVMLDTWYGMKRIRAAITEAGFILMKNKRSGGYGVFKKKPNPDTSLFNFNPELLDMDDVEESTEDEKAEAGQPA